MKKYVAKYVGGKLVEEKDVFIEDVTESYPAVDGRPRLVLASTIRKPLEGELDSLIKIYEETGVCEHKAVFDEDCWIYDIRCCYVCGSGCGTV